MKMTSEQRRQLAIRLEKVGCPVETPIQTPAGPGGLIIGRGSSLYGSMLVDCGEAGTLVVLNLRIRNDTQRRISLSEVETGFELQLPWSDCYFRYFTAPSYPDPKGNLYAYCGTSLVFGSDEVLNHRHDAIAPGRSIDGLLIDVCLSPIPENFVHGDALTAKFLIANDVIGSYSKEIRLGINRISKSKLSQPSADRRSIFDQIEGGVRVAAETGWRSKK